MKKSRKLSSLFRLAFCVSLALAATVNVTGMAFAVPASNSLPAPNYVNGATLQYSSGLKINNNAGSLSTPAQTSAANAANSSSRLNIDLGTKGNNVADLNYNTFNIGNGKSVNFNFGGTSQAALNRVTQVGDQYASKILGSITQTGQNGAVFVINPNGILFGAKSRINVGSFTASTLDETSNTLSNPSNKSITFTRGSSVPHGIVIDKGSSITSPLNLTAVSDGIIDNGGYLRADKGNLQLVTADGVTFKYFGNYTSQLVSPDSLTASLVLPKNVIYPDGIVNKLSNIVQTGGTISGHNINIISKIDSAITSPLSSIVNLDGFIATRPTGKNQNSGIFIFANNTNFDPQSGIESQAGVKINRSLNIPGFINITADTLSIKDINAGNTITLTDNGGGISTGNLKSKSNITFNGRGKTGNISSLGNVSISTIFGTIYTGNINARGNVELDAGGDENLGPGELRIEDINAGKNVILNSNGFSDITTEKITSNGNVRLNAKESAPLGSGDIQVKDVNASKEISLDAIGSNITTGKMISKESIISGLVENSSISTGDLFANKDVISDFVKTGNISAGRDIFGVLHNSKNLKAGRDIILDTIGLITQDLKAGRDITISAETIKTGNINLGRNLKEGLIQPDGTLTKAKSVINKNITAGNNVDIAAHTVLTGKIKAGGHIHIDKD